MKLVLVIILLAIATQTAHAEDTYECLIGYTKCADGQQCILEGWWCDGGDPDCDDGSDEANCVG